MISLVAVTPPAAPVARSRRWVLHGARPHQGAKYTISMHGSWRTLRDAGLILRDRYLHLGFEWCAVSTLGVRVFTGYRFQ